jgi:hypothetical protein
MKRSWLELYLIHKLRNAQGEILHNHSLTLFFCIWILFWVLSYAIIPLILFSFHDQFDRLKFVCYQSLECVMANKYRAACIYDVLSVLHQTYPLWPNPPQRQPHFFPLDCLDLIHLPLLSLFPISFSSQVLIPCDRMSVLSCQVQSQSDTGLIRRIVAR